MKNDTLEEIKLELYKTDLLQKKFTFECFNENILTYGLKLDNEYHEISLINDSLSFFAKEKAVNLLDRHGLTFLQHSVYISDEKGNQERLGNKIYSPVLDEMVEKIEQTGYFYKNGDEVLLGDIMHDPDSSKHPYIVSKTGDLFILLNANNSCSLCLVFSDYNNYEKIGNFYEGVKDDVILELLTLC